MRRHQFIKRTELQCLMVPQWALNLDHRKEALETLLERPMSVQSTS